MKNKKGVSIMVGYVLLVTFVIILGAIVYQWMKTYVPTDEIECPDGVSIFIEDYECSGSYLNLTLKNNGKFNIGGYFIYATNSSEQELATIDLSGYHSDEDSQLAPTGIKLGGIEGRDNTLTPNEEEIEIYDLSEFGDTIYAIEIVPIRWQEENNRIRLVSCSDAEIRESIVCS